MAETTTIFATIFAIILWSAWAYALFRLSRSPRAGTFLFYLIALAPFAANLAVFLGLFGLTTFAIAFTLIVTSERLIWSITAYEAAGEDRIVWFILILLFPFFGWFFYRLTNIA